MTPRADDLLSAALDAHRRGDLAAAVKAYRACLTQTPDHPETLRLLGLALYQRGSLDEARNLLRHAAALHPPAAADLALVLLDQGEAEPALAALETAIAAAPDDADAWSRRGRALLLLHKAEDAVASLERAVDLSPLNAEAIFNLGCAYMALGRWDEARDCFDAVLSLARDHAAAWNNRGVALARQGRLGAALSSFDAALEYRSNHAETLFNRAAALRDLGRAEDALADLSRALSLDPGHRAARLERGRLLCHLERTDAALADFGRAIQADPGDIDALYDRGTLLARAGRFAEAATDLARAAALSPAADIAENLARALVECDRFAEALAAAETGLAANPRPPGLHNARGQALNGLGRLEEALAAHDAALAADPASLDGWHNRGLALDDLGRPAEAIAAYDRALALAPDDPDIRLCRALSRLTLGDFSAAWPDFPARHRRARHPAEKRHAALPDWDGRPLAGTLLLAAEQGYGDTLQFGRFIPLARADRLIVEAPEPLLRLLAAQPGIAEVAAAAPKDADACCPLPDLPHRLGPEPVGAAWLTAPSGPTAAWAEKLADLSRPRLGIAWRGRAETRVGPHLTRSLPLARLLAALPAGAAIVPLQKDITPGDAAILAADARVRVPTPGIADFADVAGIAANLDLIVSIDSAPAHLALALGLETWIPLPFSADWRWGLPGRVSPWYPAARLFRQTLPGDWDAPLAALSAALAERLS